MSWQRVISALGAVSMLVSGCGTQTPDQVGTSATPTAGAGFPVVLKNCGIDVEMAAAPARAISVNQPATELMLTLGLADRMVGTASWNEPVPAHLAEANAKVPELSADFPSLETVLDTEPDFVYATFAYTFSDQGIASRERFAELGIPTYLSASECSGQQAEQHRALTFEDIYAEIGDIARIFGVEENAARLVTSLKDRVRSATAGLNTSDTSLMYWYSATRAPYIAGCCGAPGLITQAVGARNAFADSRQLWPETSWEAILDRDPDVLVLADLTRGDDGDTAAAKIEFLENDPLARKLTAVREQRYVVVPGTALDPSLRNVDAVEMIADVLRQDS
ncbi:ABC transporter substrate-binding protein [Mycolicibacterium neoaurum]|uniref:ABC transporter substrate-binding protein n=1 Tax=Mycolicibacterium neoaurum TaxID=1795 RepID=UPI00248BCC8E|nr:ABC transporter substrate-binding protein [Mycolicibacterium neoaurum]WBP95533.1 ABC transporter substrate-binding protein [Mycolicibacterium neoaurum]WBS09215.1 ABC transporter substrate-binding protein [Mycolicibacterium neoaurum]